MIRLLPFLLLLILPACKLQQAGSSVPSPRPIAHAARASMPNLIPMASAAADLSTPPETNSVFSLSFSWTYTNAGAAFLLDYGTNAGGPYPVTLNAGTSNFFRLTLTNWPEENIRHFFTVRAVMNGQISEPSAQVFWPPFPPDHFRITWPGDWPSVSVFSADTPGGKWALSGTVTGTNVFEGRITPGAAFFRTDKPDPLSIGVFNPRNTSY